MTNRFDSEAPEAATSGASEPLLAHRMNERGTTNMLQLSIAIERIEYARVIVERHVRSAADADRIRLIEISECLTSALTRLNAHTRSQAVER